ncbi:MAG: hypothetical protein WDO73_04855 [Ignavibacteriota bacterium]
MLETLDRWGIRRFQDLAALPPLGIAERLGPEGLHLRQLARGEAERKLLPLVDPLKFEDEIELDYPVELLEPLAFLLARLINSLATSLAARALATNEIRLQLKLENRATHDRILRLPVPTLDTKAFLKLLQLDLSQNPPPAPVVAVRMAMNPVKPQSAQSGLFIPAMPEPVKLELDHRAPEIHRWPRPRRFACADRYASPRRFPHDAGVRALCRACQCPQVSSCHPPLPAPARRASRGRFRPSQLRHRGRDPRQNSRSRRSLAHFRGLVDRRPLAPRRMGHRSVGRRTLSPLLRPPRMVRRGKL